MPLKLYPYLLLLTLTTITTTASLVSNTANAATVDDILAQYQQQGAGKPKMENGEKLWTTTFNNAQAPQQRSCASCHTQNLHNTGKHARTKKPIDPMAPSTNKERLTDARKIEKWFKRNCKWTLGRECNVQEKADILSYILSQ